MEDAQAEMIEASTPKASGEGCKFGTSTKGCGVGKGGRVGRSARVRE